jgi:hypothetical protein
MGSFGTFDIEARDVKRMLEELRKLSSPQK